VKAVRLLAWRRLRVQPLRAVVASLTVGAGVAIAVAVVILLGSLETSVRDAGRALAGPAPLRIIGPTARAGIPEGVVERARGVDGVSAAVPLVQGISLAEGADARDVPVVVLGVDCSVEAIVGSFGCTPGSLAAAASGPPFVAPGLAARLGPGSVLRTDIGRVPLDAAIPLPGLALINGGHAVVFPLARAQQELARPGAVDVVYVQLAAGADLEAVRTRLAAAVGPDFSVLDATEAPPQIGVILIAFVPLFTVIALLTLAVGAVLVYNSVTLSVEERRRQLAIIAALGASPRVTVVGILAEAGVIGLVGGAIGAVGGALVARPITASLDDFTQRVAGIPLRVHVEPFAVIIALALGAVVAVLAAVRPARRALRLDVAAELANRDRGDEAAAAVSNVRIALLTAVAVIGFDLCLIARHDGALEQWQAALAPFAFLLTTAVITLLVGAVTPRLLQRAQGWSKRANAPVRLGLGNLLREPRRTGVMAVALGLAVGTGLVTSSFGKSVRTEVRDNLTRNLDGVSVSTLDPNNNANVDSRLTPDTLARLAALPGVASVERGSVVVVGRTTSDLIAVVGYDRTWFDGIPVVQGTIDVARYEAGEVLIGPGLARSEGLRAGSTLSLSTATGPVDVTVLAVLQNGDSGGRNVSMTLSLLERIYGPQPPLQVNVRGTPGTSPEELARTIRDAKLDPSLQVRTASELADQIGDAVERNLAPFQALQRALLAMGFVAVLSTLLLVGVQRRRELAMLVAIGMRPVEVARMVIAEAAIVAVGGAVVGLAAGVALYAALLQITPVIIGYRDPFILDVFAGVVYAVIGIAVALLGAAWPAWRAARAEVLPALQYE
jgi:putative ABC transport system permease protein